MGKEGKQYSQYFLPKQSSSSNNNNKKNVTEVKVGLFPIDVALKAEV